MTQFEIVAHRGIPTESPENTIPSFQKAIALGADAIELDVRLTSDNIPIVYHYFYLDGITSHSGPIFQFSYNQVRKIKVLNKKYSGDNDFHIPTLAEVLEEVDGKVGLEIEIKGPEIESSKIVADTIRQFQHLWSSIEITSYEPILLLSIREYIPELAADLLFPRSEDWMRLDVVSYLAIHRARMAKARAVHLHPSQITEEVVKIIRDNGIEIHAWDVNDELSLRKVTDNNIKRICTDQFEQALAYREKKKDQKLKHRPLTT